MVAYYKNNHFIKALKMIRKEMNKMLKNNDFLTNEKEYDWLVDLNNELSLFENDLLKAEK